MATPQGTAYEVFSGAAILKPETEDREYRFITLANGLQCMIISDPTTPKAAAAMDVHVGHLLDPEDAPGLAHFCEHLLFMGNEKYPSENEYSQFLASHGGSSNAFTDTDSTNYYFDVIPDHLPGAFDRFIQFFISPLFDPSCTEREMRAVDSEHKKNLQSDSWRTYQLQKDLSNPAHPFRKFGTGNLQTLGELPKAKGLDIRDVLMDFHAKWYSASISKLVVLGKEPLDELVTMVVDRASAIRTLGIKPPSFGNGHPLSGEGTVGHEVLVKPVKNTPSLEVTFPLPDLSAHYRTGPGNYVAHLIGHESAGSVLALLKKKGWAQELSCYPQRGAVGFEFFKIQVALTEEGCKHHEDIVVILFQYIQMLKKAGPQQWIWDEKKDMSNISFRFQEKYSPSSFASRLAGSMQRYPPEHVISGSGVVFDYDQSRIDLVLDQMRPDNFRILFMSPTFDTTGWDKAQWYGTEYLSRPFSENLRSQLSNLQPNADLFLPERNEFIPSNFNVRKTDAPPLPSPSIVVETPTIRLWHKKDDTFFVPKGKVVLSLKSPLAYASPLNSVLTKLYVDLVEDALNQFGYYASVAGLNYYLDTSTDGVDMQLAGYNHKLPVLLTRMVHVLKNLEVDPDRFKNIKEQAIRNYRNWSLDAPVSHASYYLALVTQEKLWTSDEKLEVIEDITAADIQAFYPQLLSHLFIEGLVMGNFEIEEAQKLVAILESELKPKALPRLMREITGRTLVVPEGGRYIHVRNVPNPNQVNSAIEYDVQLGDVQDDHTMTRAFVMSQIAKEPCFNILRTQEQLGYLVQSGLRQQTGMVSFRVLIQSERDPWHLETRIMAFFESLRETMIAMPDEEYNKHLHAVATRMLEKDKNLGEEARRLWSHVAGKYYDFEEEKRLAEMVKALKRNELLEFFDATVNPKSKTIRKLSVHMRSPKAVAEGVESAVPAWADGHGIFDEGGLATFKMGLTLGKGATPVAPISSFLTKASRVSGESKI
ncbi:Insulinase (Peptidase M16) [Irineochytrium annulatum]|nr:Insulinase (Peptidase M16) [Irineochytrium annulatum]